MLTVTIYESIRRREEREEPEGPGCARNLATQQPEVVDQIERILAAAHAPSEWYHEPGESKKSLDAKRRRAKSHPLPPSRQANQR